jgi:hypothetical protein
MNNDFPDTPLPDIYRNALTATQAIDERLKALQGLNFQDEYQAQLASGQNPLPGYSAQAEAAPPAYTQWAQDPSQGGLGLASRAAAAPSSGSQSVADPVDQHDPATWPGWLQALHGVGSSLEAFSAGVNGRQPLFMQQQKMLMDHQATMGAKKQALAQQLLQQEEARRNKDEDQVLGIWKDPNVPLAMKKKLSLEMGRKGNPMATNLARLADEQAVAEIDQLKDYLPKGKLEELIQTMRTPNADLAPVEMALGYARERKKATQQQQFNSERFSDLLQQHQQQPFDPSSPQFDELKTLVAERKKKDEEAQKLALDIQHLQTMTPLNAQKAQADIGHANAQAALLRAPREMASGQIGASGEQFTDIFNPQTGKTERVTGTPLQRTMDMNAAQQKDTIDERAVLQQIAEVDKLYEKDFVGQIDNLKAWAKETAPGVFGPISGKEEKFRKTVNQIVTNARRLDAGTAQSVQELAQLAKTYPDLGQHETVFTPALEAMRERITARLQARNRLAAEIRAGKQQPTSLTERASQLAVMVSAPGFAKTPEEAKQIARDILKEEMKLGIVKGD